MTDFARGLFGDTGITLDGVTPTMTNFVLDAATDAAEWVFQMPEAATITTILFRYGLRTGTPPTFKASLQGVNNTTGAPNGTILGGGSPASVTFTPPADATWDGTIRAVTLDNSIALTRGQLVAIVIAYDSGTIDGTNNSSYTTHITQLGPVHVRPYAIQNNAGSRAHQSEKAVFGLRSASKTYGFPLKAYTTTLFDDADTPDEYAMRFNFDAGYGSTFTVAGGRLSWRVGAAALTSTLTLYDGTTALQTVTIDHSELTTSQNTERLCSFYFDEVTLSTLNFGSEYRLSLFLNSGGATGQDDALDTLEFETAGDLTCLPYGTQCYLSTRTDAGAWTDVPTRRPVMGLYLGDWTAGGAAQPVGQALATYL